MVDHFIKFGLTIFMKNKKVKIILSAFKQWLTSYLKPKKSHLDNGWKFRNKMMEYYLKENNIDDITGGPYNSQHQGAVEAFNKISRFWYQLRIIKKNFCLVDSINDFLISYNDRRYNTTQMRPFKLMTKWMINKLLKKQKKIQLKLEKELNKHRSIQGGKKQENQIVFAF